MLCSAVLTAGHVAGAGRSPRSLHGLGTAFEDGRGGALLGQGASLLSSLFSFFLGSSGRKRVGLAFCGVPLLASVSVSA